jgi:hypothetical protein
LTPSQIINYRAGTNIATGSKTLLLLTVPIIVIVIIDTIDLVAFSIIIIILFADNFNRTNNTYNTNTTSSIVYYNYTRDIIKYKDITSQIFSFIL